MCNLILFLQQSVLYLKLKFMFIIDNEKLKFAAWHVHFVDKIYFVTNSPL